MTATSSEAAWGGVGRVQCSADAWHASRNWLASSHRLAFGLCLQVLRRPALHQPRWVRCVSVNMLCTPCGRRHRRLRLMCHPFRV